jgi:SOS response associated peptidase (SRAP)
VDGQRTATRTIWVLPPRHECGHLPGRPAAADQRALSDPCRDVAFGAPFSREVRPRCRGRIRSNTATPKDAEEPITSCSIITTAANREVRVVHDRMPVILDGPGAEAAWLSADADLDGAVELVKPFPDGRLEVYPVSTLVNNARNEGIELTDPLHG